MKPKTIKYLLIFVILSTNLELPEWYFVLTEILATAGFAYITYFEVKEREWISVLIFLFFTVFFNPIWPIHIHRQFAYQTSFICLFFIIFNILVWDSKEAERKKKKEKEEKEEKEVTTF